MAFARRNHLVWTGGAETVVLHLSTDEVTTLVAALRAIRQHGHTRSMLGDAAEILHQVMASLSPAGRARHLALAGVTCRCFRRFPPPMATREVRCAPRS